MKICVTGGAGFIGSHLAEAYIKRGDHVLVLDNLSAGSETNLASFRSSKLTFLPLDIRSKEAREKVKEFSPDLINHHAAQKSVRESVNNPMEDADINLLGLINVMEGARESSCRNVIFASSGGAMYGEDPNLPSHEEVPKSPYSPYATSKIASETYFQYYVNLWNFNVTSLRYANVYGPRQDAAGEAGVVAIFMERLLQKKPIEIFGSGLQTRDFVFVKDIVEANLKAGSAMNGFQYFNVGTETETSIKQLSDFVATITEAAFIQPQMKEAKPGETIRSCLNTEKIRKALDWKPGTSLQAGLQETAQWFREKSRG